jgi:cytochrome c-type biogenesis protein CcmH
MIGGGDVTMAMNWLKVAAIVALVCGAAPAAAVQPDEVLRDPSLETRARSLSHELRCMVCQNQSIDDSDAPLARDLRILVRERLTAGDSDAQVVDFLVARYGEFVLLRPRLAWHTLVLWLAPPVVLIAGAITLALGLRRRRRRDAESARAGQGLTEVEQRRVAELLTAKEP